MSVIDFKTSPLGAQLTSLTFQGKELLWQNSPGFWHGPAPILFPICGFLKNGSYFYNGNNYHMPTHGFAQNCQFNILSKNDHSITYELTSNKSLKEFFPFDFSLKVSYEVVDNQLLILFTVANTGKETLPFSLGWHPGFYTPEHSYVKFNKNHFFRRQVKGGLIGETEPFEINDGKILLNDHTFKNGGIVLENHLSAVTLVTPDYQIDFHYENFPNLVLWGQPLGKFICLEPWHGMGDSLTHNQQFLQKQNLLFLPPNSQKSIPLSLSIVNKK